MAKTPEKVAVVKFQQLSRDLIMNKREMTA